MPVFSYRGTGKELYAGSESSVLGMQRRDPIKIARLCSFDF